MKINICKIIDYERLDKEIDGYRSAILDVMPYLIMSDKTRQAMAFDSINFTLSNANAYYYKGCRIATDNGLEFGEVDIR